MAFADARIYLIAQAASYILCAALIAWLWWRNHRRYNGLGLWVADFVMQALGFILLALRNVAPDWAAIILANALIIGGMLTLYAGLARFAGQRSYPLRQTAIFVAFMAHHSVLTFVWSSQWARDMNAAAALCLISLQSAWLILRHVDPKLRPAMRGTGYLLLAYGLGSAVHFALNLINPQVDNALESVSSVESLLLAGNQLFILVLSYLLTIMVQQRYVAEVEEEQATTSTSEAKYRQLAENLADAIWVLDAETLRYTYISPSVQMLCGRTPEEMMAQPADHGLPPDEAVRFRQTIRERTALFFEAEAAGETASYTEEMELPCKDGSTVWTEVVTRYVRNSQTGRIEIHGATRDISERKRTEAVMALRLDLLDFAADHALDELLQHALDRISELARSPISFYHFVEPDQATLSLQAWSTRTKQEFCKAEGAGMHYALDQAGVWVDCVREGKPVIHNDYATLPHRKGLPPGHAPVIRELVVPTYADRRIVAILGIGNKATDYTHKDVELVAYIADVVWNIIDRKQREEELRNTQRRLEAQNLELRKLSLAIEQSGNTIVITDQEGTIEYANPRFEATSGYTLREAMGENPRVLKSGEQNRDYYREMWETITSGDIWRGEFHNRRKDGSLYWESATIAPVQDDDGSLRAFIAIKEDITERKEAESALRAYTEQLTTQNAELDAFAHTVAHDLKNPIAGIIGYAMLLEEDFEAMTPDELRASIRAITMWGEKLDTIVEELLLLSSVRKEEVVPRPIAAMGEAVAGACDRLSRLIAQTKGEIIAPPPDTWPIVLGHAPWLEEVWTNYISNALKYGGSPPRVELGWQPSRLADSGAPACRFWVRDNGDGLTDKAQAQLFAPFIRLEQVRAQGHGLGLSIVRRIMTKLGGDVGVDSAPGAGSTFWFTLPTVPDAQSG